MIDVYNACAKIATRNFLKITIFSA